MTDLIFPPWCRVSDLQIAPISNAILRRSIYNRAASVSAFPGDMLRFGFSIQNAFDSANEPEKAALQSFLSGLRGSINPFWMPIPGYSGPRGSFPVHELFINPTFAAGTSNWSSAGNGSLVVSDRVGQLLTTAGGGQPQLYQSATLTQYAPHIIRCVVVDGRGTIGLTGGPQIGLGLGAGNPSSLSTNRGLLTIAGVASSASADNQFPFFISNANSYGAGDFVSIHYTSLSRCALVDNGQNLLLRSDTPGGTSWTNAQVTAGGNGTTAPDGTLSDYFLAETTVNNDHNTSQSVTVSSSAADFSFGIYVKPVNRSWCYLQMTEATGATAAFAYFNVSSGTAGISVASGNWSNLRTHVVSAGNGWYRCYLTARKTNAATSISVWIGSSTGNGVAAFTGVTSPVALLTWRATLAQSSVPTRPIQTIATATTGTSQTGTALHIKGGPASANSSLLSGDWVQIGDYPYQLPSTLNFDAAGIGYLKVHRPVRSAPADNAPVIVNNPMGRFILANQEQSARFMPGRFADFEFLAEEALED